MTPHEASTWLEHREVGIAIQAWVVGLFTRAAGQKKYPDRPDITLRRREKVQGIDEMFATAELAVAKNNAALQVK